MSLSRSSLLCVCLPFGETRVEKNCAPIAEKRTKCAGVLWRHDNKGGNWYDRSDDACRCTPSTYLLTYCRSDTSSGKEEREKEEQVVPRAGR